MLSSQQKEHPIYIDPDVADKFKDLRDDVQQFSIAFTKYLEEKEQELEQEATRLQGVIEGIRAEIDVCVLCSPCSSSSVPELLPQVEFTGTWLHTSQNYLDSKLPLPLDLENTRRFSSFCCPWGMYAPPRSISILITARLLLFS